MLFDDVELLFDELVGDIHGGATAYGALLLGFEVTAERLCARWVRLLLRLLLRRRLLGRLGALLERQRVDGPGHCADGEPKPRLPGRPKNGAPKREARGVPDRLLRMVTLHDAKGEALDTIRCGCMQDSDGRALVTAIASGVLALRAKRPELQLMALADGSPENWKLLCEEERGFALADTKLPFCVPFAKQGTLLRIRTRRILLHSGSLSIQATQRSIHESELIIGSG